MAQSELQLCISIMLAHVEVTDNQGRVPIMGNSGIVPMSLLMVAGILVVLAVLVAVASQKVKRRSCNPLSKPLGATRITPTLAAKVQPPELPGLADQSPRAHSPEVFRKEQALLAASQGSLDRSQLLLILDNASRMGLSALEVSLFERALNPEGPSPAKAIRRISYPELASNKSEQVNSPKNERVPYKTYVQHDSPPVIVPATKRKSSVIAPAKGRGEVFTGYYGAARPTPKPMTLPVKPPVRKEGKGGSTFVWPIQKDSAPVSSSAHTNTEPVSDAADTTVACKGCGECFSSNHELRAHKCVLMRAESRGPELPCGGCGRCYACRYLRVTRGE
jgi:hypothetical protein